MNNEIVIIRFKAEFSDGRMNRMLDRALAGVKAEGYDYSWISSRGALETALENGELKGRKILVAVETGLDGINLDAYQLIKTLNLHVEKHDSVLEGSTAGILIDGKSELYTKELARRLAFSMNRAGCTLPGKPLVEATGTLGNFTTLSRLWNMTPEETYEECLKQLVIKVLETGPYPSVKSRPLKIAMVHASNRRTSNSLALWQMVRDCLEKKQPEIEIQEISILNGQLSDCRGCSFEACLHNGENGTCFYGGPIVEKAYPAVIGCDIMVLVCPNYNDSVSANIMAFINRLTAVFRSNDFSTKRVYALVVSGYSGGDLVTEQIIGAINMNKNFMLPPEFAMLETANDAGSLVKLPGIGERAETFAENMLRTQE